MLVTWVSGGHQMVGSIESVADGVATVSRLTNSGLRPDMRELPLERLREPNPGGPEAEAFSAQVKLYEQQAAWLAYHDGRFDEFTMETYPDSAYAKEFPLTPDVVLRSGRAHVVNDWLTHSPGYVFLRRLENRFGKVIEAHGYLVDPLKNWPFITRTINHGELPRYGTVIESQDGVLYVVRAKTVLKISNQFSTGEAVIVKETGEKAIISGCNYRRGIGMLYSFHGNSRQVSGLELERTDTDGDLIIK